MAIPSAPVQQYRSGESDGCGYNSYAPAARIGGQQPRCDAPACDELTLGVADSADLNLGDLAMLSVHKILGGPSAASYYLDQVAQGREDYYAGEGEEAGRWTGAGALLLEWSGEVDGDDLVSLLAVRGCASRASTGWPGSI